LTIQYNPDFRQNLVSIWRFIACDSVDRANSFKKQLKEKIANLSNMPYKFRQSLYYDDKNIRDLIFKGYTVPYLIDIGNKKIVILDIFKWIKK